MDNNRSRKGPQQRGQKSDALQERRKARELRHSLWWRQQIGRGICHHCGKHYPPSELTMDHLTPLAWGGRSTKKNCVPSCKNCNTQKGGNLKG